MDKTELKGVILERFNSSYKPIYYSDFVEEFNVNIHIVIEACKELVNERKIVI